MYHHASHHAHHGLGIEFWLFVGLVVAFVVFLRGQEATSRIFRIRSLSGPVRPDAPTLPSLAGFPTGETVSRTFERSAGDHADGGDEATEERPLAA